MEIGFGPVFHVGMEEGEILIQRKLLTYTSYLFQHIQTKPSIFHYATIHNILKYNNFFLEVHHKKA